MEAFEIQLLDKRYLVEPHDNGTFRILDDQDTIGVIYPEPGDLAVEWKTMDNMEVNFVGQLGELIAEHQMN